jgi:hypothetical protein
MTSGLKHDLKVKNSIGASTYSSIQRSFFHCNIDAKDALFFEYGHPAHIFAVTSI